MIEDFGNSHSPMQIEINSYVWQCSITMNCSELAKAGSFLAQHGTIHWSVSALVPGEMAVAVWSPGLDAAGNSLAGTYALERFTTLTKRSIF
jgi:glutaminase